ALKHPQAPEIFQKPIAEIDLNGLPPRDIPGFSDAVIARYALEYASKGWNAVITVDDEFVRVVAIPENSIDPKKYVLGLLQHRYLDDALPILEALYGMVDDAEIAYNYGICLSELGRIEDSVKPLQRCTDLDADYTNAYVGLGVAYTKLGRNKDAERALREAIYQDPKNAHAKRNLAAVLARSGKHTDALPFFRQAVTLAPNDPGALLGLAQCLDTLGGDHRKESNKVYDEIARRFDDNPIAEVAKKALTRIANEQLHATVDGEVRMDAVFYMQGAMDDFARKSKKEIGQIVMEIAIIGQTGLQINKPDIRYTLKILPGEFSGLQLVSIMHTGILLLDPKAETGTGLDREYELATAMRKKDEK
ncbi:MAG: tetratricopeptide repeat protein, partial [Pyrinomonadaceae bacterium]